MSSFSMSLFGFGYITHYWSHIAYIVTAYAKQRRNPIHSAAERWHYIL
jgi:hypothetical protein